MQSTCFLFLCQVSESTWCELKCSISDSDHFLHVFPCSLYRNGSIIVDYFIFTSPEYSGTPQDLRNALTGRLNNSRLGVYTVKTPVIEGKLIGYVGHAVGPVNKSTGGSHKRGELAVVFIINCMHLFDKLSKLLKLETTRTIFYSTPDRMLAYRQVTPPVLIFYT